MKKHIPRSIKGEIETYAVVVLSTLIRLVSLTGLATAADAPLVARKDKFANVCVVRALSLDGSALAHCPDVA